MCFHRRIRKAQKYYVMPIFLCIFCLYICPASKAFAFAEMESATTFRGEKKSLVLPLVPIYVELGEGGNSELVLREWASLWKDSAAVVKNKEQASLYLTLTKKGADTQVSLVDAMRIAEPKKFILPKDADVLQKVLLGYAHNLGLRSLQSATTFPDVVWNVQVWTPAKAGQAEAKNIHGEFWKPLRQISGTQKAASHAYEGRTLLSFSFKNTAGGIFYIYAFNATDSGQIIPILAPTTVTSVQNTLLSYKEHSLENMFLELGAHEENVILIISREPLDLSLWQQDDFTTAAQNFLHSGTAPAPENWSSRILTFIKK